jgi:N-acetylglutamate synthase-like GNAT family acetyltransferase
MTNNYRVSTDQQDFNIAAIHDFLTNCYWAKGIPMATLQTAINNSLCFAVLCPQNETVGFARMITDKATFAYLADVYILDAHRGKGLSKRLMQVIVQHPELQGLRRTVLATRDAHGLYEQFGYKALANPQTFMEVWQPDIYKQSIDTGNE